jgi:quercetin dioxygenase-like cupin family protein
MTDMPTAPEPTGQQPLTRAILLDAHLTRVTSVSRVEIREIRMLPGHAAGLHVHNGPVVGSIARGTVTYRVDGQPASVLHAGDVFVEPEGARVAQFDAGDEGATWLAYFLLAPGQEPGIEMPGW